MTGQTLTSTYTLSRFGFNLRWAQNVQTKTNDNRGGAFNFTTQNNAVFKAGDFVNGAFTLNRSH